MADGVRDDGRGRVALAEEAGEAVGREHFGDGEAELAPEEARVVADDDHGLALGDGGLGIPEFGVEIVRDALSREADAVEGEVARDETAPAGGAEFDGDAHEGKE